MIKSAEKKRWPAPTLRYTGQYIIIAFTDKAVRQLCMPQRNLVVG